MRLLFAACFALSLPAAALAQDTPSEGYRENLNEFADSMRKLFEGFADDLEPMMKDLAAKLEGLRGYHPPEVLPNGDIIIRRKTPQELENEPSPDLEPDPETGDVEL